MPPTPASVHSRSTTEYVRECMNSSVNEIYWINKDWRWKHFLIARNNFVRSRLLMDGVSPKELKELDKGTKLGRLDRLESQFATSFFQYSRDEIWMQEAIGPNDRWISVPGMCAWQIRAAIQAIGEDDTTDSAPQGSVPVHAGGTVSESQKPFDPVRDSIVENAKHKES